MAEVSRQPNPHLGDVPSDKEALMQTLDDLLERYLFLLDEYQSLQHTFSKQLSSGYLDLAQANFSNPSRIRYGQDFYDERMQATTQAFIDSSKPIFSIKSSAQAKDSTVNSEPLSAPSFTEALIEPEKSRDGTQAFQDPINWFGFLIPPALRSSQTSFKSAVIDSMPALMNLSNEMKEVEIEVRRMRKRLGKLC